MERWCFEINIFVFFWGEVIIILEDVIILGGYFVFGDFVFGFIGNKEIVKIEEKLVIFYLEIFRGKL